MSALDRAIEALARARAPKEPPRPAGQVEDGEEALERAPCPLCGGTRATPWLVGRDDWQGGQQAPRRFGVVRCTVCAARYTTPRYKRAHRHLAFGSAYPFYLRAQAALRGEATGGEHAARAPFVGRAERSARVAGMRGRVLDVGAGDGFFLAEMRDRGFEGVGIDVEPAVVRHARERLRLDCRVADVEQDELPAGPFELITLWGVLQLLYEPQRALSRLCGLLAPRGVLAVGVSNAGGALARLFGARWRGLGLPRHLVHYTPESLERLLAWSGFTVVERHFETPRWIVAGSVDAALPSRMLPRRAAKAALYGAGALFGGTPLGDTMELYARPAEV